MVVNEFQIVNNVNSSGIKFHFATGVSDDVTINNVSFPVAGQKADQTYARNWGGFKRMITVDFVLRDDGTDKSTDAASKVTLSQQWDYLIETVIQDATGGSQSDLTYTVTIYREGATKTYTGALENINLRAQGGLHLEGSLTLMEAS